MKTAIRLLLLLICMLAAQPRGQAAGYEAKQPSSQTVLHPIEPIEPQAKKESRWKKLRKELGLLHTAKKNKTQVEPIPAGFYIGLAVYIGILAALQSLWGISFLVIGLSQSLIFVLLALVFLLPLWVLVLYIIKLISAANGTEERLPRYNRFVLGYLSFLGLLIIAFLIGMVFLSFASWSGISNSQAISVVLISIGLTLPILIFNIIDHIRYRKYKKELKAESPAQGG